MFYVVFSFNHPQTVKPVLRVRVGEFLFSQTKNVSSATWVYSLKKWQRYINKLAFNKTPVIRRYTSIRLKKKTDWNASKFVFFLCKEKQKQSLQDYSYDTEFPHIHIENVLVKSFCRFWFPLQFQSSEPDGPVLLYETHSKGLWRIWVDTTRCISCLWSNMLFA